ncbi:MAG: chromosome segregation protein SMC [Kofleriaceae bacterium]|nr:chromosome segregation protein SMC [Kofleriaceae bacterium]
MRIKRVEIIGFKSFCDRAVINIDTQVTAVVGPNGCGKSNIVDAIRWCMGEQSAKHLRGKAMEDVIFNGSESRGPAPMAEVSLTFDDVGFSHETLNLAMKSDEVEAEAALSALGPVEADDMALDGTEGLDNSDGDEGEGLAADNNTDYAAVPAPTEVVAAPVLWTDADGNPMASPTEQVASLLADEPPALDFASFTEVSITRRLFRDGTSQYYINKVPCRLRDITDFFLGTGVGTKAYAIIEQGRIGQIVSSRPGDRRLIIEEAAGITKFKSKKKAAERKLDQTRQNLLRVSDIVAELDKRMGNLRRQAQKAERYRKYKGELRDIDLWKASHRYLELRSESSLVGGRLHEVRTDLDDSRAHWLVKDAHVVAERADLSVEERRLLTLQEALYELDNRIRLSESKIGFERREADELDARSVSARAEHAELVRQLDVATTEFAARSEELTLLLDVVEREASDVTMREAQAQEARQMAINEQGRLDEARARLSKLSAEIATCEAQLDAMNRRRDDSSQRLARVLEEAQATHERVKELEREARKVEEGLGQMRQTKLDLGSQAEHFAARQELLADDVARGEAEVETLRTEAHRRSSRLTSLKEIEERYEGFARGTRAVMQRSGELADTIAAEQIVGLVADVVRAPQSLEIAVEAALGDRIGGVLVSDSNVGAQAISYLKRTSSGRSAFVPMAPLASMSAAGGGSAGYVGGGIEVDDRTVLLAASVALGGEGVLGRMSDLVAFADGFSDVGRRLFGSAVVVENLTRALELHDRGVHDVIVTLDGDIVEQGGVVAGGSRESSGSGILAQKREIRDLEQIVVQLQSDLTEATARLVNAKTELKQVQKAIEGLRTSAHEGDLAIMGFEKDAMRLRGELERMRERAGYLAREQQELDERLSQAGTEAVSFNDRRDAAVAARNEIEIDQTDTLERVTDARMRLEELVQSLTEAKVRAAQLGEKRASLETAVYRLETSAAEITSRMGKLDLETADSSVKAQTLRAACDALAADLEILRNRRLDEATALETGRHEYEHRIAEVTGVEIASRELRSRVDRLSTELGQLELRMGQVVMNQQVLETGIADRYQVDLADVVPDYHQHAMITEVEEARLAELRDLLDRMGTDINLTAIDEFAEVSQRFDFLTAQRADLDRAVDQLQKAIDKINKTSRRLFKETYTAINNTFKTVFPRLFRGGQAALSLTGGEDVDLLEAGIEIMAQPPGKKNTTVEQLSGGEKALTAVALVFSIFLIKPSPFCILDEVDAPLDEANVDRYNEIVREMTDRSQFIVITHNKRTMESADNLYGVTMQEPGCSKLVTVNLSKVGKGQAAA